MLFLYQFLRRKNRMGAEAEQKYTCSLRWELKLGNLLLKGGAAGLHTFYGSSIQYRFSMSSITGKET